MNFALIFLDPLYPNSSVQSRANLNLHYLKEGGIFDNLIRVTPPTSHSLD